MLQREEEFLLELEKLKSDVEGTVRVASIYSIGLSEMSRVQDGVRRPVSRRRSLHVEYMRPDKVYDAVLADAADLGLVSYPEASREMAVIPWRDEEMAVALPPAHPLAEAARARAAPT